MRIRKLAPAALAAGAIALLFAFAPAQASTQIEGSIRLGHPIYTSTGLGWDARDGCQEIVNEDGTPDYEGNDGVWIDLRGKATPGTKLALTMDQALDADAKFFAMADENEDGELECTMIAGYDQMAKVFLGEAETGEMPPGAEFIYVYGYAGHGKFTLTIG